MAARNLDFNQFTDRLGRALNLPQAQIGQLNQFFRRFNDADIFRIISNVDRHVAQLEDADRRLADLIGRNGVLNQYADRIQANWDAMNEQLAQLQILSLIQRVENCDGVINQLLDVLNNKIRSVNQILEQNLNPPQQQASRGARMSLRDAAQEVQRRELNQRQGGGNDIYMTKYLKYKNKYLSLKKMI